MKSDETSDKDAEEGALSTGNGIQRSGNTFAIRQLVNYNEVKTTIVIVDFNTHSSTWRYLEMDASGEELEASAERLTTLSLINSNYALEKRLHLDLILILSRISDLALKFVPPHQCHIPSTHPYCQQPRQQSNQSSCLFVDALISDKLTR